MTPPEQTRDPASEPLPTYAVMADWHRARADRARRSMDGWSALLARDCTERHRQQYEQARAGRALEQALHLRFAALAGFAQAHCPALAFADDGRLVPVDAPESRL